MTAHRLRQALAVLSLTSMAWLVTAARAEGPADTAPTTVRFRIVDVDRRPVPGARVWLIGGALLYGNSRLLDTLTSNAEGVVEVPEASAHSCAVLAAEGTRLGWSTQPAQDTDIVLTSATVTLKGWVLPLPDGPVLRARVRVRSLTRPSGGAPGGHIVIPEGTGLLFSGFGGRGHPFTIEGVPADCQAGLTLDDGVSADVIWSFVTAKHSETLVALPAQQVRVVVRDHAGKPLAGRWVAATSLSPTFNVGALYFPQQWAQTDRAGRAVFSRLYRGFHYQFGVTEPGWYSQAAEVPAGTHAPIPSLSLVADHGGRVEGRITRPGATPISHGYTIFAPEGHPQAREFSRISADVGPQGQFATTLPEGTYALSWLDTARGPYARFYELGVRVTVHEGQTAAVNAAVTASTPVRKVPAMP